MASVFIAKVQATPSETFVQFSGPLNEHAQLPELITSRPIRINLKLLTMINSIGTRKWVTWAQNFKSTATIFLEECPPILVNSFSMVKGVLIDAMVVSSFYIPFYSEKTGERKEFLAERNTHFDNATLRVPTIKDSQGNPMEIDVHPSYLSFLKQ